LRGLGAIDGNALPVIAPAAARPTYLVLAALGLGGRAPTRCTHACIAIGSIAGACLCRREGGVDKSAKGVARTRGALHFIVTKYRDIPPEYRRSYLASRPQEGHEEAESGGEEEDGDDLDDDDLAAGLAGADLDLDLDDDPELAQYLEEALALDEDLGSGDLDDDLDDYISSLQEQEELAGADEEEVLTPRDGEERE